MFSFWMYPNNVQQCVQIIKDARLNFDKFIGVDFYTIGIGLQVQNSPKTFPVSLNRKKPENLPFSSSGKACPR
jgi:hypothetical protein